MGGRPCRLSRGAAPLPKPARPAARKACSQRRTVRRQHPKAWASAGTDQPRADHRTNWARRRPGNHDLCGSDRHGSLGSELRADGYLEAVKMQGRLVGKDRGQEAGKAHRTPQTPRDDRKMELVLPLFYHVHHSGIPPQVSQIWVSITSGPTQRRRPGRDRSGSPACA